MIALPLSDNGAVHETVARPGPDTADTDGDAVGVPAVTALLIADTVLLPAAFPALTVNRYVVPFVSPVTTCVVLAPYVRTGLATPPTDGVT